MKSLEHWLDFVRAWNRNFKFHDYAYCNGLVIGHRPEKWRSFRNGYESRIGERFKQNIVMIEGVNGIMNQFIDRKQMEKENCKGWSNES